MDTQVKNMNDSSDGRSQSLASRKLATTTWILAHPLLQIFPLIPAFLALFAPVDILDRFVWLRSSTLQFIEWFPFLGSHAAFSSFPQVTTLVQCVSWALLPVTVFFCWTVLWPFRHQIEQRISINLSKLPPASHFLLYPIIFPVVIFAIWMMPGDPSFCQGCTTNSRPGLALLTYSGLLGVSVIPVGFSIVAFLHLKRRKRNKGSI